MKVLITGMSGYIAKSLEDWLLKKNEAFEVEKISLRSNQWKEMYFGEYDVVVHTVGIAHVDSNPSEEMKNEYFRVNRDLAIQVAEKSRNDGVRNFIHLSSIIIYGKQNEINHDTLPQPENFYGRSKLEAEVGIKELNSTDFKISILRLPMVYGESSKGNYPKLSKLSKLTPIFPKYKNKRSMIHIQNLCQFIYLIIKNKDSGIFHPQNSNYVQTSSLVREISKYHNKKIIFTRLFNPVLKLLVPRINIINKVFGDLYYHQDLSVYKESYNINSFEKSVQLTENEEGK